MRFLAYTNMHYIYIYTLETKVILSYQRFALKYQIPSVVPKLFQLEIVQNACWNPHDSCWNPHFACDMLTFLANIPCSVVKWHIFLRLFCHISTVCSLVKIAILICSVVVFNRVVVVVVVVLVVVVVVVVVVVAGVVVVFLVFLVFVV